MNYNPNIVTKLRPEATDCVPMMSCYHYSNPELVEQFLARVKEFRTKFLAAKKLFKGIKRKVPLAYRLDVISNPMIVSTFWRI